MSHVLLKSATAKKHFVGKTIERINAQALNVVTFYFTDGTAYAIEVESMMRGLIGCLVGCVACVAPKDDGR